MPVWVGRQELYLLLPCLLPPWLPQHPWDQVKNTKMNQKDNFKLSKCLGGPYICNWMNGRDYCGKRYSSAEELLVHLKTHTNLSTSDPVASSGPAAYSALLSQSLIRAAGASQLLPSALSLQVRMASTSFITSSKCHFCVSG